MAKFVERDSETVRIKIQNGEQQEFELIKMIEFDSERKRMTVAVKDLQTQRYFVFLKGANDKVHERRSAKDLQDPMSTQILNKVDYLGSQGLRTLVFAMRELTEAEFN